MNHARSFSKVAACFLAGAAAGCTHAGFGSTTNHFATFQVEPPTQRVVHVCHGYGCQKKTKFVFREPDLAEVTKVMAKAKKADTPAEERRAVAYAIGWIENRVGDAIGTKADRPGMDFAASGDPTQQDCVDEATNTTSYMSLLAQNGLIKHHTVGVPFAKENYLQGVAGWTHWTGVLHENSNGQRFAVDSWIYGNGENPAVVEADKWYMTNLSDLPKATR